MRIQDSTVEPPEILKIRNNNNRWNDLNISGSKKL